jgi:hypothetical protein
MQLIWLGRGCTAHSKGKKMDSLNVVQIGTLSNSSHECVLNEGILKGWWRLIMK